MRFVAKVKGCRYNSKRKTQKYWEAIKETTNFAIRKQKKEKRLWQIQN
jgi:hypothetical protein